MINQANIKLIPVIFKLSRKPPSYRTWCELTLLSAEMCKVGRSVSNQMFYGFGFEI